MKIEIIDRSLIATVALASSALALAQDYTDLASMTRPQTVKVSDPRVAKALGTDTLTLTEGELVSIGALVEGVGRAALEQKIGRKEMIAAFLAEAVHSTFPNLNLDSLQAKYMIYTAFEEISDNLTKAGVPLYSKRLEPGVRWGDR